MMKKVVSLELNEVNFAFVQDFVNRGHLPNFRRLLEQHQLVQTKAEDAYPLLEPWIQWPTVYTGKTYAEHGIFRLGDVVDTDHVQIWEYLEERGATVGAISPINAANRCKHPAFFLPDPWTNSHIDADASVARLFGLVCQIVNANASDNLSFVATGRKLLPLAAPFLRAASIAQYTKILNTALRYKWAKAAFLDRLLADMFLKLHAKHQPHYSSLFLNAGAHIQHHHMFDSDAYEGERRNPAWYSAASETKADPLLFIYEVYDAILADMLAIPDTHVFITTGLSQQPNDREHYQYRIKDFEGFINDLKIVGANVQPRMSRDFLLEFSDETAAKTAVSFLSTAQCAGKPLFSIEDRGMTLFCQTSYFGPPDGLKQAMIDGRPVDLSNSLVLVSIENGIHQTIGFHIDTQSSHAPTITIPLMSVFDRLCTAVLEEPQELVRKAS